jgi:hypothetical protein
MCCCKENLEYTFGCNRFSRIEYDISNFVSSYVTAHTTFFNNIVKYIYVL